MNQIKRVVGQFGIVLCSALLGCTAYGQPSVAVGISVPLPSVEVTLPAIEIHAESDFYEPLAPQGEWVVVGSYGRCWRPAHVEANWRPYCNGGWQRTDAGWYWVSDEPWAWATYHYGRWDYTEQYGWYWMPQTQWAPAWVSWHEGGGYVGWAPLQPSVTISVNGYVGFSEARISPRAYVFVEQRQFLSPIRPSIVVVNNTTIINKTRTVTHTKIVNNTVINEGPNTAAIEKVSGHKVQSVPVQELRHKSEAAVATRQRASSSGKKSQAPAANEVESHGKNSAAPSASAADVKVRESQNDKHNPSPTAPDSRRETRPEANHSPAVKEPTPPNTERHIEKKEKPVQPSERKAQRPDNARPDKGEQGGPNQNGKDQHEPKN